MIDEIYGVNSIGTVCFQQKGTGVVCSTKPKDLASSGNEELESGCSYCSVVLVKTPPRMLHIHLYYKQE